MNNPLHPRVKEAKENRRNRAGSHAQLSTPRPRDNNGRFNNWGTGVKDSGAGCWYSYDKDVRKIADSLRIRKVR